MGLFDGFADLASSATEALGGGLEGITEALDPTQLVETASDQVAGAVEGASDAAGVVEDLNPFA